MREPTSEGDRQSDELEDAGNDGGSSTAYIATIHSKRFHGMMTGSFRGYSTVRVSYSRRGVGGNHGKGRVSVSTMINATTYSGRTMGLDAMTRIACSQPLDTGLESPIMGRGRISVWSVRLTNTIGGGSIRSQRLVESRIDLVGDGGIF